MSKDVYVPKALYSQGCISPWSYTPTFTYSQEFESPRLNDYRSLDFKGSVFLKTHFCRTTFFWGLHFSSVARIIDTGSPRFPWPYIPNTSCAWRPIFPGILRIQISRGKYSQGAIVLYPHIPTVHLNLIHNSVSITVMTLIESFLRHEDAVEMKESWLKNEWK